mgnify:CR=1 FL=1
MAVEQSRTLVTSVPGPKSLELAARKAASVANGVGTIVPAYVVEACVECRWHHLLRVLPVGGTRARRTG